jgi:hypothetical protein
MLALGRRSLTGLFSWAARSWPVVVKGSYPSASIGRQPLPDHDAGLPRVRPFLPPCRSSCRAGRCFPVGPLPSRRLRSRWELVAAALTVSAVAPLAAFAA